MGAGKEQDEDERNHICPECCWAAMSTFTVWLKLLS